MLRALLMAVLHSATVWATVGFDEPELDPPLEEDPEPPLEEELEPPLDADPEPVLDDGDDGVVDGAVAGVVDGVVAGRVAGLGDELPPQPETRAPVMPSTASSDNNRCENNRLLLLSICELATAALAPLASLHLGC
jgi:hypothetical protein